MIKPYFKNIKQQIAIELDSAKTSINIAVCWFTNKELFEIICKKLSEGVSVSLVVLNDSINNKPDGLDFQNFIDLGGTFYFSSIEKPMHNKYCIIDSEILINGSYNWTYFAENKNKENVMIIHNEAIVSDFLVDFNQITKDCKLVIDVEEDANTIIQESTIVEDAKIASSEDIVIKAKKDIYTNNQLILMSSLGQNTHNDVFSVFLSKGMKIPVENTLRLTTISDNQTRCSNDIRVGENTNGKLNEQIGLFYTTEIPPMEKGVASLITTFSIDIYGILTVSVKIPETKKTTIHKFNIEHLIG